MPTNDADGSSDRELLVSHQGIVRIEEINGIPVARFSVEPSMQGHTFAVDLSDTASAPSPIGPFRIEYASAVNSLFTKLSYPHLHSRRDSHTWR